MVEKYFKVKAGITTPNVTFSSRTVNSNVTANILGSNTLSISGNVSASSLSLTTALPITSGGTGSITAPTALSNLGGLSTGGGTITGAGAIFFNDGTNIAGRITTNGGVMFVQGGASSADTAGELRFTRTGSSTAALNLLRIYSTTTQINGALTVSGSASANSLSLTTALPIGSGGTGATTAGAALTNLTGYQTIVTAAGTTTLTSTSPYQTVFTGSLTQTVRLPDVTTLQLGQTFVLTNNATTNAITLQTFGGGATYVNTVFAGMTVKAVCVALTGTTFTSWLVTFEGATNRSGTGSLVYNGAPQISGLITGVVATQTSGTNAQGQGTILITTDVAVVTTTATNPSGVTLSASTSGRRITIINRGTNPIVVYPPSGSAIDALATDAGVTVGVNAIVEFNCVSTTLWYSSIFQVASATSLNGLVPVTSGGTGVNTSTGSGSVVFSNSPTFVTQITTPSVTNNNTLDLSATGANIVTVSTNGAERLRIDSSGNLISAAVYASVVGVTNRDLFIDNTGKFGYVSSIRESKMNIQNLAEISWLYDLNPVLFNYRKKSEDGSYTDEVDGGIQYGMIAEDVENIRPDLCFYDETGEGKELRGIQYSKLVPVMLKAIQELKAEVDKLRAQLNL